MWGRRAGRNGKGSERREPTFGGGRSADLRVSPEDRVGGGKAAPAKAERAPKDAPVSRRLPQDGEGSAGRLGHDGLCCGRT